MPSRNNSMIRRDINRLNDLVNSKNPEVPALAAISSDISDAADKVNQAWQAYQSASVQGDKERSERDSAITRLLDWIQNWRPVIMIKIPGASSNLKKLPVRGATPDDAVRVAEDMLTFINNNTAAESFKEQAVKALGARLGNAKKETVEATATLPQEALCRDNFTEACVEANTILIRGLEIVRSAFGRTSPEYKQFIARASMEGDEEEAPVGAETTI